MAKSKFDSRTKVLLGVCAVLLAAAVICLVMTFEAKTELKNTLTNLSRTGAHYAAETFSDYYNGGEDYLYTAAVADYNNFLSLFFQVHGEDMNDEFLVINEVYGQLIMNQDVAETWIPLLVHVLNGVADDLTNAHAHEELLKIRDALAEDRAATEEDLTHSHEHEH